MKPKPGSLQDKRDQRLHAELRKVLIRRVEHPEDQIGAIFMLVRLAVNGGMIAWSGDQRKVATALASAVNINLRDIGEKAARGEISLEQGE